MTTQLVWLRADLRCHDNPALFHACQAAAQSGSPVIALFFFSPQQWRKHGQGNRQQHFLLQNLAQLSDQLDRLHIPLKILQTPGFAEQPKKLVEFCKHQQVTQVYWNDGYEWNERQRDQAVTQHLDKAAIAWQSFTDQVIYPPGSLLTGKGDYYTVFTPFYRKWLKQLPHEALQPLPCPPEQRPTGLAPDPIPQATVPRETTVPGEATRPEIQASAWPPSEEAALKQLGAFCTTSLQAYHRQRDFPAVTGSSQLSPWLALGVLSPRQCLAAAWHANAGAFDDKQQGAGVWVSELVWREFYRHLLVGFPRISRSQAFKTQTEQIAWRSLDDPQVQKELAAWKAGQTGFPLVDAAMRQLNQSGWMHNRLRMLTAMFLSKHLLIDWRVGEAYFAEQLLDWDLAANNGGWQWAASTGTDAVPYFRLFNPYSQSQRFDPKGDFIRQWIPELRALDNKQIHQPPASCTGYPRPIIDLKSARERVMQAFKIKQGER